MIPSTPTIDAAFRDYAELMLRHHQLLVEGKEDAPETEAVEDELTAMWEQLDAEQRSSLAGIGSDLNWLRRRGEPAPRGRKAEEVTQEELDNLQRARDRKDWPEVLQQLRLCGPAIPILTLARLRAVTYEDVGLTQLARRFQDFAAEVERSHG